jgi:hypothetical protein
MELLNEKRKLALRVCAEHTGTFAKTFFPDRFDLPFSKMHNDVFELIDDPNEQLVVIAANRGWGKTTTMNIAHPAKNILFKQKKFIVPVSATATKAEMDAENLKRELVSNPMIKEVFGPMKSKDNFSKTQWVTQNGVMVMPRGAGQQVRGILFNEHRPDLIVVDDLEDSESVQNEDLRKKLKDWFFDDLLNSVNRSRNNWKIIVIGTVLHEDSLLVNLLEDPEWASIRLELCDDNEKSNWPDFMSDSDVKKLAESYRRRGQLDNFYREYRNIPISTEDAVFRQEYFNHYEEPIVIEHKDNEGNVTKTEPDRNIENYVIIDPAKTLKIHSADTAIVGIGLSKNTHKLYVRDVVSEKMYPDEIYDEAFSMVARLNAMTLGVEVTSLNEFILQPLKNEMRIRNMFPNLIELKARGSKEERIAHLVPYYRQGFIYHNSNCCGKLETQLLTYPRSKLWDIMDALAYIIELLELNLDYFDGEDVDYENDEAEYEHLMNDSPVKGWRKTEYYGI